jgi:hypothetical protein
MAARLTDLPRMLLLRVMAFLIAHSYTSLYPADADAGSLSRNQSNRDPAPPSKSGGSAVPLSHHGRALVADVVCLSRTCRVLYNVTNDEVCVFESVCVCGGEY